MQVRRDRLGYLLRCPESVMTSASPTTFTVRHVALGRSLFAAIAAIMITFSGDHSASLGLAAFSGFAIANALLFALSAWLVFPAGERSGAVVLAFVNFVAGAIAGVDLVRNPVGLFAILISWAAVTGLIELMWGLILRKRNNVERRDREFARDAITQAAFGFALAIGVAVTRIDYVLPYEIEAANLHLELTGVVIAVGLFGGYAAITAVFQAIAGFSPQAKDTTDEPEAGDNEDSHASLTGKGDQ